MLNTKKGGFLYSYNTLSDLKNVKLPLLLKEKEAFIKELFNNDCMLKFRNVKTESECFTVVFFDGLTDGAYISESIIKPLLTLNINSTENIMKEVLSSVIFSGEVTETEDVTEIVRALIYGSAIVLSSAETALIVDSKNFKTRAIEEPADERILKGPREGFNEVALFNISLLRRRLLTFNLITEQIRVGRRTDTAVYILYLKDVAKKEIVNEVINRIKKIDIDGILDSNYLAEEIRDKNSGLLKTVGTTERPDTAAAKLLEGRIAVIVDGTPVVLTVPYFFLEGFQSDDDYYLNYFLATAGRIIRYICFVISVSLPGVFVAVLTFFPALLPTSFVISIAAARDGIPFTTAGEILVLIVIFEILKQTGVRMPQSLGHTLSIVGGLVVGEAAVSAKIVSAPILIVVALSGICGLMIPRLSGIVFYGRILLSILGSLLGLFGVFIGVTVILSKIFSATTFNIDYTVGLKYLDYSTMKDDFIRVPWQKMKKRPHEITENYTRQK